nr:hypothetical protein [Streptomyces sp. 846.5]
MTATVTHQTVPAPRTPAASITAPAHTSALQTSAHTVQPTVTVTATSPHATPNAHAQGAATSAAPQVVIYGCDGQPVGQPAGFILACGDGGLALQGLAWSGWGGPTATATGQLRGNTCIPNCAAGGSVSYPATVTVRGLTGGRYTSMHIDAPSARGPSDNFSLGLNGPVDVSR